MDCTDFQSALSRFMDDETDPEERTALARHRDECRGCRETLEAHQALDALMADIPALSPPALRILPFPSRRPPGDRSANAQGDRGDGGIPRPFPLLPRTKWLVTARACAAVLAVVALFLLGRATLPKAEDHAFRPQASTAPAALAIVREVDLGDSTYRVTVEGEGTRLLACRVEDGPGRAVEVDCSDEPEPGTIPSGGVK